MSSRGERSRSDIASFAYSSVFIIAAPETSLAIPLSGSRWKDSSIQRRNMSRSSSGTPSNAAMT